MARSPRFRRMSAWPHGRTAAWPHGCWSSRCHRRGKPSATKRRRVAWNLQRCEICADCGRRLEEAMLTRDDDSMMLKCMCAPCSKFTMLTLRHAQNSPCSPCAMLTLRHAHHLAGRTSRLTDQHELLALLRVCCPCPMVDRLSGRVCPGFVGLSKFVCAFQKHTRHTTRPLSVSYAVARGGRLAASPARCLRALSKTSSRHGHTIQCMSVTTVATTVFILLSRIHCVVMVYWNSPTEK
jgi:hypothetical protein